MIAYRVNKHLKMLRKPVNRFVKSAQARGSQLVRTLKLGVHLFGRHRCTVCSHRVGRFLPIPEFIVENIRKYGFPYTREQAETCNSDYKCPFCGASDRDRLYALYIQNYLLRDTSGQPMRIVDFAPSEPLSAFIQSFLSLPNPAVSYRTADLYRKDVDDQVDITDMQIYEDERFDFFICSHILEHVPDDRKALRELHRILKPGGKGILMVPIVLGLEEIDEDPSVIDEAERWRRFGQFDHVRLYSKAGFLDRVRESGFKVHQYGKEFFGEQVFTRSGITHQSVLYVVEK